MNKAFEPILGFVTGLLTIMDGWQTIYSLLMAFGCGIMAWLARELCSFIAKKIKERKQR